MSWRVRLLLLATVIGVVPSYFLPALRHLEWKSYDQRLATVRPTRGNIAPSTQAVAMGLDEEALRNYPGWGEDETRRAAQKLSEAGAVSIWIEPGLALGAEPAGVFRDPTLPYRTESDGSLRRVDLFSEGRASPALRLYAALHQLPPEQISVQGEKVKVGTATFPRRLALTFPVSEGRNYLKPVSLSLLRDEQTREAVLARIQGAAVLISNQDVQGRRMIDSPVAALEGSQIEFAALDTLLSGWLLKSLPWPVELAVVVGCVLLLASATFFVQSTWVLVVLWLSALSAYHWFVGWAFVRGVWLPEVPVIAASLIAAAIVAVVQRIRAFRLLRRLLGAELAVEAGHGKLSLGGKERQVTIVFTNLPNAIKALEKDEPKKSIRARNEYNAITTRIVRRHLGWMLDYQGDAQMAGFGVEQWDDDHALHAVRAAFELQRELSQSYPEESIHCGVYSGPAAVGLVGAPGAKALAAIGDTTNVAARLMGAAMKQKVGVLIGSSVYSQCAEQVRAEKLPPVALKGKTSDVEVYSVVELL